MKVTRDGIASQYLATEFSGPTSFRGETGGIEPVHTIVADRDATPRGQFAGGRRREGKAPPAGVERRKRDRRQRKVNVLLDTRVTPSRRQQRPSVDEEA